MNNPGALLQTVADMQNGVEEVISEDEARKRREQLNRRPSYRMILKDLETADKTMKTEPDDSPPSSHHTPQHERTGMNAPLPPPSGAAPLHVQIPGRPPVTTSSALSRLDGNSPYASPIGGNLMLPQLPLNGDLNLSALEYPSQGLAAAATAAIVAATRGSQITPNSASTISANAGGPSSASSDMHSLKGINDLATPSSFTGNVTDWTSSLMSQGYSSSPSPTLGGRGGCEDESTRKRQVRLLKNREAAKECRRKKKEYVKCLENRVAVLENQNKALIEELKTLKELYCRKEKNEL